MDLSLGSNLTCLQASSKDGSGGLSVRFSKMVVPSERSTSEGLTGYARVSMRQSARR